MTESERNSLDLRLGEMRGELTGIKTIIELNAKNASDVAETMRVRNCMDLAEVHEDIKSIKVLLSTWLVENAKHEDRLARIYSQIYDNRDCSIIETSSKRLDNLEGEVYRIDSGVKLYSKVDNISDRLGLLETYRDAVNRYVYPVTISIILAALTAVGKGASLIWNYFAINASSGPHH